MEHKRVIDSFVVRRRHRRASFSTFRVLQDYLSQVSMRLTQLIQAEVSVLVDVIRAPYALFPETNECRTKFISGTFVHKYVLSCMTQMPFSLSSPVANLTTDPL